jgi:hypothetical protein
MIEPTIQQAYGGDEATRAGWPRSTRTKPWAEARARLAEAEDYWLATVRPDGRPHLVPVLAVVVDGTLHFSAGHETRKAKNLARSPRCVVAINGSGLDLVLEGTISKVTDEAILRLVAEAYVSKYGWHVTVRDGAFHAAGGAPTAGPPPYFVYAVTPTKAFGLPTDEDFRPTRWRFD